MTEAMVATGKVAAGDSVLDVGCGTGGPACHLAAMGARVTGITTSPVGVAASTERAERAGSASATVFLLRDGMDNGFGAASFDTVWVLESSHLMRRRDALVAECARVLRPGRLALCDVMLRRAMPFEEARARREELALLRDVFGAARLEELGTYVRLAEAGGLTVDVADDLTDATRPTFTRWRENALHHFLDRLERRAALVMVDLLEEDPNDTHLHRALLDHAHDLGILRYRRSYDRSHLMIYRTRRPGVRGGLQRVPTSRQAEAAGFSVSCRAAAQHARSAAVA